MSVAETGNFTDDNSKFAQEFEEYRRACQMKYQQQKPERVEEEEEKGEEDVRNNEVENGGEGEGVDVVTAALKDTALDTPSSAPLPDCNSTSPPTSGEGDSFKLNSSVEMLKTSGSTGRRNSLSKVMSFCSGVFKKTSSPSLTSTTTSINSPSLTSSPSLIGSPSINREKERAKMERKKAEQDWRMARFIAELEYSGKTDEEIQLHLFHLRDQAQFSRPRSNSIGDWFKDVHQAFKDEFSARRDRQCVTLHVSTTNPFAGAVPANYVHDMGYSYEDLVALESVPRGLKSLDHLPTAVFEGQELPSNQTTCAICMAEFETGEDLRSLHCAHFYHKECIDKWLGVATACPVCKGEVHSDGDGDC